MSKKVAILALTLHQPWCWAMSTGAKTIENRTWRPWAGLLDSNVETWIALHAGATYDVEGEKFLREKGVALPQEASRVKGAILGIGRLVGCVTKSRNPMFFGPFGWEMDSLRALESPIVVKGQIGLWRLSPEHEAQVRTLLPPPTPLVDPRQIPLFGE